MFNKKLCKVCSILFIFIMFLGVFSVYASMVPNTPGTRNEVTVVTNVAKNIWSTLRVIFQILAISAIIIAGLRYMFASADGKADIKNQTIILIVGAILVFSAVEVAKFVANTANSVL